MKAIIIVFLLVCAVLAAMTEFPKKAEANSSNSTVFATPPDQYGVVCYKMGRNFAGDPLSCVKVK